MMIPIHDSEITKKKTIIVKRLGHLTEYDFTEAHRHHYFEFFYFVHGGGEHFIDFVPFPINNHSVHIVGPGQVHQMKRALDSEGYVFLFELSSLEVPKLVEQFLFEHACLDARELPASYKLTAPAASWFQDAIQTIQPLTESTDPLDRLKIQSVLQILCTSCLEKRDSKQLPSSDYLQFRELLKEQIGQLKKVKEYAEKLGVSERSLNEMVKAHTGLNASSIIYKQITMESKRLLRTGMTVKEVAYALNFDDPSHFSKFFKSQTNLSPSEYRDQ